MAERNGVTAPETLDHQRRFFPEQLQGLRSIKFTFVTDVRALSLDQLSEDHSVKYLFGSVTSMAELGRIVPVARHAAVNPNQPFVKGSEDLGYDDQLEQAAKVIGELRRTKLKKGTLEGIDFAPDKVSVLLQLNFAYQARFGRQLLPNYSVRSQDEYNHLLLGPRVALVGRSPHYLQLSVLDWSRQDRYLFLMLSLVATPAGPR